jgi:outer membrane usher protein
MKKLMFQKRCAALSIIYLSIVLQCLFLVKPSFSQELAIVKLVLNEEVKGDFFVVLADDEDVWIKREEFESFGFREGLGEDVLFEKEIFVSLRSIAGIRFHIDETEVALIINAEPSLFKKHTIVSAYKLPYDVIYSKDTSAFLNYASVYIQETAGAPFFSLSGELGISVDDYLAISTFNFSDDGETEDLVRLMTSLSHSDRAGLRTVTIGDFSALSGILGSSAVLGGLNFSKNFSIDPYLLKYPGLNLSGTVETPSDVEVYLNGLLVRRERLSPGEFLFTDVPATIGHGTANIIIKDAYGKEEIITSPFYYTDSLLKRGLHEYSYSIGFIREDLGVESFEYGRAAFMGFHNYGLSRIIKLGYAAEATEELINIGPTASILLSNFGVLDFSFAYSNSSGISGYSGLLSYTFRSTRPAYFGANFSLRSNSEDYSNLITKPSDDKAKAAFSGTVSYNAKSLGSIALGYSSSNMHEGTDTSRVTVTYSKTLSKKATLFTTFTETRDVSTSDEIFIGLHLYLGDRSSGSISYRGDDDHEIKRASIHKSLPLGTGFGYRADIESSGDNTDYDGTLQYQGNYGRYEAGYFNREQEESYRLSVSGGIGYIDNSIFFSRPITDSFAKVDINNIEGVRVYHFGNEAGRTDRNGSVIVPHLRSYENNRISIESRDIPINYAIGSLTEYVSPPSRGGALVTFDIRKIQGIIGTVNIMENGENVHMESGVLRIEADDGLYEGLVGRGGEFYIENVPSGKHTARIIYLGRECKFDIIIPDSEDMLIDLGEMICE